MHDAEVREPDPDVDTAPTSSRSRTGGKLGSAKEAGDRHVAVAVPLRAIEQNRRVAASVLAGGLAYRLFLWLLPVGLLLGGALGLSNADSTQDAVEGGGLPGAITNAIGDAARSAHSDSWWLFAVGIPLLLWAGFSGAKAVQLVHALVWDEPPPKTKPLQASLAFTGMACAVFGTVALTWWVRGEWPGLLAPIITVAPLAGLWLWVSLHLPHRDAVWRELVPGALLVSIGFQVLHAVIGSFLVPKLEKSTSLYGDLGATATFLFFMFVTAYLVVASAVLNRSLHDELSAKGDPVPEGATRSAEASPA
jgi:uncharacterized BrkB/YihY/UPF0761 family membrane protein